ncbi:hypothetical protein CLOM_g15369 [Closterium sp. NIES-68]|nr:hypothetical protein CLOM_g15369 [Closterium sp. NIES-68]GJP86613.1 hypothetical protein CLOP_g16614 [Closterium sp. NIES-67]
MASTLLSLTTFSPLSVARVSCRRSAAQKQSKLRPLVVASAVQPTSRSVLTGSDNAACVATDPAVRSTATAVFTSLAAFFPTALPVLAEEVAVDAAEAAAAVPDSLGYVVLAIPLVAYGGFYLFRSTVNPRAGFLDFAFVLGATVIVANLLTSFILKVRLY